MIRIINPAVLPVISGITDRGFDILKDPFVSLIIWHIFLIVVLLLVFNESIHGFEKTKRFIRHTVYWLRDRSRKQEIDYLTSKYREDSKKVYLGNAIAVVVLILFMVYLNFIFFTVVVSDSMNPTLKKGDLVLVQKINVKPQVGDIVTFKAPDIDLPITHRITSISGNEFRVKGDANSEEDTWRITEKDILGKIVTISEKPVIIRGTGEYFIADATQRGRTYGTEFTAISNLIKGLKLFGYIIFWICIILYLAFSIRDSRRMNG